MVRRWTFELTRYGIPAETIAGMSLDYLRLLDNEKERRTERRNADLMHHITHAKGDPMVRYTLSLGDSW